MRCTMEISTEDIHYSLQVTFPFSPGRRIGRFQTLRIKIEKQELPCGPQTSCNSGFSFEVEAAWEIIRLLHI